MAIGYDNNNPGQFAQAFPINMGDLSSISGYGSTLPVLGQATSGLGAGGTLGSFAGGLGGMGGSGMGGLGFNLPTAQLGLQGLSSLAGLYGAFSANRLARDQFNFTKDVTNTNLTNQIQSYNTALADRARSRAVAEGRDQASADDYVDRNRLSR